MHNPDYLNDISELAAEGVHQKTITAVRIILGGLETAPYWGFEFAAFARRFNSRLSSLLPDPDLLNLNLVPGFNALRDLDDHQVDRISDPVRAIDHEFAMSMAKRLHVVGLAGEPGSGRDTLATRLVDAHGFTKMSFEDPLRMAVSVLYNLPMHYFSDASLKSKPIPSLGMSPLECLEAVGSNVCQGLRRSIWSDRLLLRMASIGRLDSDSAPKVVVTGMRYEDEAEFIRSIPGGQVAWVSRTVGGRQSILTGARKPEDLHLENAGNEAHFMRVALGALGLGPAAPAADIPAPLSALPIPAVAAAESRSLGPH